MLSEDHLFPIPNPHYHSPQDLLTTLNLPFAVEVTKAALATIARLAEPLPVPYITLIEPDGISDEADESYLILWEDFDPFHDAEISLYYDIDTDCRGGTLIVSGISEDADSTDGSYVWDTSKIPAGRYYIYAVIDNGEDPPFTACSPGPILISHLRRTLSDLKVFPNPMRTWCNFLNLTERATIRIYNVLGQRVVERDLKDTSIWRWDGTGPWGGPVANGVYLYVVRDGRGDVRKGKLVVVR